MLLTVFIFWTKVTPVWLTAKVTIFYICFWFQIPNAELEYSALVPWALSAAQGQELHLQKLELPAAYRPSHCRIFQIMPKNYEYFLFLQSCPKSKENLDLKCQFSQGREWRREGCHSHWFFNIWFFWYEELVI